VALGGAVGDMETTKFIFLPGIDLLLCDPPAGRLITIVTELSRLSYSRSADLNSI
jgi:hypothetical protein